MKLEIFILYQIIHVTKGVYKMIYLLGGCPLLGKTTVAREISFQYRIPLIEADDICSVAGKTSNRFNLFEEMPYYDYFTESSINKILDDAKKYQEKIEPILAAFIQEKALSGDYIIEGFSIMPHMIKKQCQNVKSFFLVATNGLIERQYERLTDFGCKSKNKGLFDSNYLERLKWYNTNIRREVAFWNSPFMELDELGSHVSKEIIKSWNLC